MAKSKGFGAQTATKQRAEEEKRAAKKLKKEKRVRSKGKTSFRQGSATSSQDVALRNQQAKLYGVPEEEPESQESMADVAAFEDRLAAISQEGDLLKKEKAAAAAAAADPNRDIYAAPPTIGATAAAAFDQGKGAPANPAPAEEGGPNRVAVGLGAIILAIIVAVSSGDYGAAPSKPSQTSAPSGEARKQLLAAGDELEKQWKADSADTDALEGAAVTFARAAEYKKAERLLVTLTAAKPTDVDVWRLLAETRLADGQTKQAVEAYGKAMELAGGPAADIEIFKGYTSALVQDGKAEKAVEAASAAVADVESGRATGASAYEMRLLLGKVYSGWAGHLRDATAVYDGLIVAYPEDFRAYLTKGLLLREAGQKGDAERMFLQARFYAPKEARAVVDRIISQ